MLVTSDPNNAYSRIGLIVLGMLDLGVTSAVWLAILVVRWVQRSRTE